MLVELAKKKRVPKKIIEIGAGDHDFTSQPFIDAGWRVIMFEPNKSFDNIPDFGKKVTKYRLAISDHCGDTYFLYNPHVPDHSRIPNKNYYSAKFGHTHVDRVKVNCITYGEIFRWHPAFKKLGMLVIDVEGYDEEILKQVIASDILPSIIVVEHQHNESRIVEQSRILGEKYKFYSKYGVNSIYIKNGN